MAPAATRACGERLRAVRGPRLKAGEAALGFLASADGAIYALRRALYRDLARLRGQRPPAIRSRSAWPAIAAASTPTRWTGGAALRGTAARSSAATCGSALRALISYAGGSPRWCGRGAGARSGCSSRTGRCAGRPRPVWPWRSSPTCSWSAPGPCTRQRSSRRACSTRWPPPASWPSAWAAGSGPLALPYYFCTVSAAGVAGLARAARGGRRGRLGAGGPGAAGARRMTTGDRGRPRPPPAACAPH